MIARRSARRRTLWLAAALSVAGAASLASRSARNGRGSLVPRDRERAPAAETDLRVGPVSAPPGPPPAAGPEPGAEDDGVERAPAAWIDVEVKDEAARIASGVLIRALPPPEAQTRARGRGQRHAVLAISGADGSTRLGLPSDWPDDHAMITAERADPPAWADAVRIALGARTTLRLRKGTAIRGRVVGEPDAVRRSSVSAYSPLWPESPGRRDIPAGPRGDFVVVAPPGLVTLFARAPGQVASGWWRRQGHADEEEVLLRLGGADEPIAARASVVSPAGRSPMPKGAALLVTPDGAGGETAVVEEEGRVLLRGLRRGLGARIRAWPDRRADGTWVHATSLTALSPDSLHRPVHIDAPQAANARFRIVDEGGEGVASVPLRLVLAAPSDDTPVELAGWSDERGAWNPFETQAVPVGSADLVGPDGRPMWTGVLSPDPDVVTASVPQGRVVRVKLVDWFGADLPSADNVRVRLGDTTGPSDPDVPPTGCVGFDRGARVTLLAADPSDATSMTAWSRGLGHRRVDTVTQGEGGFVRLPLDDRTGSAVVRTVRPSGASVPLVITIRTADGADYTQRTGADGVAHFVGVRAGDYEVTYAAGSGFASASLPLRVTPRTVVTYQLAVPQ